MCLLVAASAFSLAPGTALAQTDSTPPRVTSASVSVNRITITFNEPLHEDNREIINGWSVNIDGQDYDLVNHVWDDGRFTGVVISEDRMTVFLDLGRGPTVRTADTITITADQSVTVHYNREAFITDGHLATDRLADEDGNLVENFVLDVRSGRVIPPEQAVYAVLGRYFTGSGSLSSAETFVKNYLAGLWTRIGGGSSSLSTGLSGLFNVGMPNEQRTAWGTDGTENWHQVGGPGGGTSHKCSGEAQPRLQGRDSSRFFFACSGNPSQSGNHWVPVKMPVAGIDFTPDGQLTWTPRHQSRGGGCMKTAFDPLRVSYINNDDGTYTEQQGTYLHQWFEGC